MNTAKPTRRDLLKTIGAGAAALALPGWLRAAANAVKPGERPNFVVIFTDDQGYADLHCYGGEKLNTPHLDKMAAEGVRFTDFYSAAPVCSAARAALLTGCYAQRVGGLGALQPDSPKDKTSGKAGLHPDEITIAKLLKTRGYATACIGKWHLGHKAKFLPTRNGFDYYFGIPYSNDMYPGAGKWQKALGYPPLPLMEGEKTIETNPPQSELTRRYTEKAVAFITAHKSEPFFLYLPHNMPHAPIAASKAFRGKSKAGLYGDVIEELDWSAGQILATLKTLGLDEKTLVIFTCDNGPWLQRPGERGSAGPFRDGKWSVYEGGMREPFIARWPGRIAPGRVCSDVASTIDVYPTLAALAGAALPADRAIDGADIFPLLAGTPGAKHPHDAFFYCGQAVRVGKWKYHAPRPNDLQNQPRGDGNYTKVYVATPAQLYDLSADPGEKSNLASQNPDVVARLSKLLEAHNADLAAHSRPIGQSD